MDTKDYFSFDEMRITTEEIYHGFMNLISSSDLQLKSHSENVSETSVLIGKRANIPVSMIELLKIAGGLHDVGKLMVDEDILSKPSRLTFEEYQKVTQHTSKGKHILEAFHMPPEVVDAAYHHHEWYDGSGYPNSVSGKTLSPITRIVSVADCYSAMREERPYKNPMSEKQIIKELRDARGTQLDPYYTDILISILINESHEVVKRRDEQSA